MLSVVKLLLKGEVGVCALNGHGNYIVDHGKSWNCALNFCRNPGFSFSEIPGHTTPGGHHAGWAETPKTDRGGDLIEDTPTPGASKRRSRWDETPGAQTGSMTPSAMTPSMTPGGTTPGGNYNHHNRLTMCYTVGNMQIQESRVRSRLSPILSRRLIMK